MSQSDAYPGWVCDGCGKHVTSSMPVDQCSDCGGRWFEATPDRLACDICGHEDASRVFNSEHKRLCRDCITEENITMYGDRLDGAAKIMRGEADELAARDDVDDHLNDVIEGLRLLREVVRRQYHQGARAVLADTPDARRGGSASMSTSLDEKPVTARADGYDVTIHRVGGREPDGSPTYIGPWTFQTKMIRTVVEDALTGRVLNACAGKTMLTHGGGEIVRNDLNPERDADCHVDVCEIDTVFDEDSFDTVVFDPPFDQAQADEHYESMHARQLVPARKKLIELVRPGGVFVELGWNLQAANEQRGWSREAVHIYDRGPTLQPVFLTVDRNVQTTLGGRDE